MPFIKLLLAVGITSAYATADVKVKSKIAFDVSVEQLYGKIKALGAREIDQAIDLLDQKFFASGNYKLFFQSQSIQPSSKKYPRVVLFGKDSKLILGFNHRLGERRSLEIIQFREKKKKWEFREISFENSGPVLSSPNPTTCLHCHGDQDAKPNTIRFEAFRLERSAPFPSLIRFSSFDQQDFWREFVANAKADKIYSRLTLPDVGSPQR